jgi:hypothetical protein
MEWIILSAMPMFRHFLAQRGIAVMNGRGRGKIVEVRAF